MRRIFITSTIVALLIVPQFSFGGDVDDFKAEVNKFLQAFNSLDANAISKMAHPELTVFDTDSPFPQILSSTEELKSSMQSWFSGLESLDITMVDPQFKVIGNTGIMIGYETSAAKPKDGPATTSYYRITMVFIKSSGKWLASTIHLSYLPTGKP